MGDERTVTPSVSLGTGYNDNILFTENDRKGSFYTVFSPAVQLRQRNERGEVNAKGKFDSYTYAERSEFNSVDPEVSADGKYALTPLVSVNASGLYKTDSQPNSTLTTTGLVSNNTKSEKNQEVFGLDWALSEKTTVGGQATFGKTRYENNAYSDNTVQSYGLVFKSNLDKLIHETTGLINLNYSIYDYNVSRSNYTTASFGFTRNLNEKYNITAWAGPSLIDTEYKFAPYQATQQWGATAHCSLDGTLEKSTVNLSFTYDLEPDSLSNTSVKRMALEGSYLRKVTSEISLGITASYFNNKSAGKENILVNSLDEDTYNISPRLLYQITDDWGLETNYRFSRIESYITDGSRTQNCVFIQLNWGHSINKSDLSHAL
ncbi:MAG: outer membrane beta-barrel protein [Desulfocapsaceae bacterium]|nr:outer membrane beta-barrel protein [Desulfocapsaceae bacterium]